MKHLIRFDWAIKKLLRSKANFGILEGFLSVLLKTQIKIHKILESEGNKEAENDKFNRLDILVEDEKGELIIIEVQVDDQMDYLHRMLYGTAKLITEYMHESESYKNVKKIISVNILFFDLGLGKDYVYHGTTRLLGIHQHDELALSAKQQKAFNKSEAYEIFPEYYLLKINEFNDLAKDSLDEWIYFLKNEEIADKFSAQGLKEAKEKLMVMKLSEPEQKAYNYYLESLHDRASYYDSTFGRGLNEGLEKGEQIGLKKGRQEGHQEGRQEGRQEGEQIGLQKGLMEAYNKLLAGGMGAEQAKKLLGLYNE